MALGFPDAHTRTSVRTGNPSRFRVSRGNYDSVYDLGSTVSDREDPCPR